jgi:hypothetical protein
MCPPFKYDLPNGLGIRKIINFIWYTFYLKKVYVFDFNEEEGTTGM